MARYVVVYSLLLLGMAAACSKATQPAGPVIASKPVRQSIAAKPQVLMQYTWHANPDSLHLYLLFFDVSRLMELERSVGSLSYQVTSAGNSTLLSDTVQVPETVAEQKEDGIYLEVSLPRELITSANVLQLKLWQEFAGQSAAHSAFRIELHHEMLEKEGVLIKTAPGKPLIRDFTTTTDSLLLKSADSAATMLVYYFEHDFAPAPPPMAEPQQPQSRTLVPQDSFTIAAQDTFLLSREGLYLLWPDKHFARGILVEPWHFPQVTMAEELVHPLIYLTTSTERERLFAAKDPKKAVDSFWLSVAGEKQLARELIRTYYGRVEQANRLYTSHKPGWATDRGMIYMVYGPPSDISKVGNTETWIYRESEMQPYIKFVFTKKENNFTENHYELIRRREYEESWYSAVAKWRAGITDM